jgi:hypothetical protein
VGESPQGVYGLLPVANHFYCPEVRLRAYIRPVDEAFGFWP